VNKLLARIYNFTDKHITDLIVVKQLTLLKFVYVLLLIPFVVYPAFAVEYDQIVSTSDGTLDVGIYTIPEVPNTTEPTKLKIVFLKPGTERIQEHIDYRVNVTKDGDYVFGPIRLTHTSPGYATIPVQFSENGLHQINIEVEGILFSPIPLETASLTMNIGLEETSIPAWIKNNAGWWAAGKISDEDFLSGIKYLIENSIIKVNAKTDSELVQKELERKAWNFEQYLKNIQNDIKNQNRYVENINPSEYVIIKYWKDYHKWNLEQFINRPNIFPDRYVWLDPETDRYVIEYKVYINEQPDGLPIDHVSTLENSFSFWEKYTNLIANDGKKVDIRFNTTGIQGEANIWITWVVRNMGEGVLGHATLGKGVIEVAIGGYGCDGSFQLLDVDTVEYVMTHELGHSIGLNHATNPDNIMYNVVPYAGYAYCLFS